MFSTIQLITAVSLAGTFLGVSAAPRQSKRWTTGHCTGHIRQHQRNENGVGDVFQLDLTLYDGNGEVMAQVSNGNVDGNGDLYVTNVGDFKAHVGPTDNNDIIITYNGGTSTCPGNDCSLGAYDSGHRDADFGFTCSTLP